MRLLQIERHTCFEAANGLEAFTMVKRSLIARHASSRQITLPEATVVYDLILMDLNMPQMSGNEATIAIRQAGYRAPIIGMAADADEAAFLHAGANLVLEKPVSGTELKKAITTVMSQKGPTNNVLPALSTSGHHSPRQPRSPFARQLLSPSQSQSQSQSQGKGRAASAMLRLPTSSKKSARRNQVSPGLRMPQSIRSVRGHPSLTPPPLAPSLLSVLAPNNGQNSVAPAVTEFATDVDVILGWEKIFSYTLGFIDPQFNTQEMRWAFFDYRRSGTNHKLIVVLGILSVVFVATRGSVATLWWLHPAFAVGFLTYLIGLLCVGTSLVNRLAVISHRYDITFLQPYHAAAVAFATSRFADVFENCGVVCITFSAGMYMLARVLQGPCPPGTSTWDAQQCNPEGLVHEVPQDAFATSIVAIISFQVCINGANKRAIAVSWAILLGFSYISMYVVDSHLFVWNTFVLVGIAIASYEFER